MKPRNSLHKGFYPVMNAYIYLILCNKLANFFPHFSISLQKVQRVFNISTGNSTTQPALMTSQPPNLSESKPYDFTPQESLSRTKYLSARCFQLRNYNSDMIQIKTLENEDYEGLNLPYPTSNKAGVRTTKLHQYLTKITSFENGQYGGIKLSLLTSN